MHEGAAPQQKAHGWLWPSAVRSWLSKPLSNTRQLAGAIWLEALDSVEQRRVFVLLPFAFIAGVILYRIGWAEPDSGFLLAGSVGFGVFALLGRRLAMVWLAIWVGYCALPIHGAVLGTHMLGVAKYGHYTFRLDSVIRDDGFDQRWLISEIVAQTERDDPQVRRARISAPGGFVVRPGDVIEARIRFYPVPPPILPGGYDAQFTGYFAGIGGYGSILGEPTVVHTGDGGWLGIIDDVRRGISNRILEVLKPNIAGIAMALINGDQSRVTEDDWETMALVGLAHVLSVSGLHLTLVAGTMFATLRAGMGLSYRLTLHWPIKKIAAAGGIVVAIAYMLISGLQVPAIRATIMLILIFGAVIAGRHALTMRNVALAGLLLAMLDPASIFRASYQLSFAAVVALIAAFELARRKREDGGQRRNRILAMFIEISMTSLVAGGATLIFTAFHFQQTAPFGVLGNLLASPIVSFVMMPAALFAMLLAPFGLEAPLLIVMGWSIEAMLWIAHAVGVLSGGFDPSPLLAPSALTVCLGALAWLAFFQTRIRLIGPVLAIPIIALCCTERAPDVLVADSTQALAVRHEEQLGLIAGRLNTFATDVWAERYMETIRAQHEATSCDPRGCLLETSQGFTIALAKHRVVFAEDCLIADLVIARIAAPTSCAQSAAVIDAADLDLLGTHALYWDAATRSFKTATAITDADRPWRIQR